MLAGRRVSTVLPTPGSAPKSNYEPDCVSHTGDRCGYSGQGLSYRGNAGHTSKQMQKSKLRWQCRRGMRELDELLLDYLDHRYGASAKHEKEAFCALLALSNPELTGYLLQHEKPAVETIAHVVECILNRSPA